MKTEIALLLGLAVADERVFSFKNQCPFPVWFGFAAGATQSRSGGQCGTDADCHSGSTCTQTGPIR